MKKTKVNKKEYKNIGKKRGTRQQRVGMEGVMVVFAPEMVFSVMETAPGLVVSQNLSPHTRGHMHLQLRRRSTHMRGA